MTTQSRIMRTYEVTIGGRTEAVNLSYELNERLEAVTRDGNIVPAVSEQASIEVMKRLRKLAERDRTRFGRDELTDGADVRLLKARFVEVPLDESGNPIPRNA